MTRLQNIIFSFLLVLWYPLFFGTAQAQTIKFNNVYEDSLNYLMQNVVALDTGYVLYGFTSINDDYLLVVQYFDADGEKVWKKMYGKPNYKYYSGTRNSLKKTSDGCFLSSGVRINQLTGYRELMLIKFDAQFDTLWTKFYLGSAQYRHGWNCIETPDHGFAIVGQIFDTLGNNKTQALLLRTDSLGNYLWHNTYGVGGTEGGEVIVNTPDGGFLIGGMTWSYSTSIYGQDWYLVKTDSLGQMEWYKTFGTAQYNDTGIHDIIMTQDSNYLITGGFTTGFWSTDYKKSLGKIIKIDPLGSVIWQKDYIELFRVNDTYPWSEYAIINKILELDSGYLVTHVSILEYGAYPSNMLYKLTPEGGIIWKHKIEDPGYGDYEYIEDLELTNDGGYVMGGYGQYMPGQSEQRMWLVKTDCNGFDSIPDAAFTDSIYNNYVRLYNHSRHADSCSWDFGDGSLPMLAHIKDTVSWLYPDTSSYIVTLTAWSSCDISQAVSVQDTLHISIISASL